MWFDVGTVHKGSEEVLRGGHGQRGSLARAEKNLGHGRFSKFSHSAKYAKTKKKRRLGNAEPRSTEPRRQMLLNTSWSHTSSRALLSSNL